ncbi:glucokinase [Viridibacterium curvum]|uniref:Glucokinase n=1 Tax=Viridibacterium curvum TaxID=1101404 RepID=A0ABP9QXG7_9RHOO
MTRYESPRLLADVGNTFARFALEFGNGLRSEVSVLRCDAYDGVQSMTQAFLALQPEGHAVRHAALAMPNPVEGDAVRMPNRSWSFSIELLRQALSLDTLLVVNDFTALAMSIPRLEAAQRTQIGSGTAQESAVIGLIGPGTGLGVSGLIPTEDRWVTLGSEGGHVSFAPSDEREIVILRHAWKQFPHVSAERLLSWSGLELCHQALVENTGMREEPRDAQRIVSAALAGEDPLCEEALQCFCAMLGSVAGNVALTLGAVGGIYIGGGIAPRLAAYLGKSAFRARFEAKGRFADYLSRIPTYVINAPHPALSGVSAILSAAYR